MDETKQEQFARQLVSGLSVLLNRCSADVELRDAVHLLAGMILKATEATSTPQEETPDPANETEPAIGPVETPDLAFPPALDLSRLFTGTNSDPESSFASGVAPQHTASPLHSTAFPADPARIADRLELKADGCDWHVQRRSIMARGLFDFEQDVKPKDTAIMDRARRLGFVWMWMCRPESPTPKASEMETLAQCYRNAARALRLAAQLSTDGRLKIEDPLVQSWQLLAEACSALRIAVLDVNDDYEDPEQRAAFEWLRRQTKERQVFVERYMCVKDPADPSTWLDLRQRLDELQTRIENDAQAERKRNNLLSKVKYHADKLLSLDDPNECSEHARRIDAAVGALVDGGMKPSNIELRDLLVPIIDKIPESVELGPQTRRVLREIDVYLANKEFQPSPPDSGTRSWSAAVARVRQVLSGRCVVLVGGQERPQAKRSLIEAFGLSDLVWCSAREHESHYHFKPPIIRQDVALVLLAIRFSSHGYAEIDEFCRSHDKPLVRLPGGYNSNQVAEQILRQVGLRVGLDP